MTDEDKQLHDFLYNLVYDQAEKHVATIARKVIRDLQSIKVTLSGDDSGLINCWDEICAQQQQEQSFAWEAYEMTMNGVIEGRFEQLSQFEQLSINFLMSQSRRYSHNQYDYDAVSVEDVIDYVQSEVLQQATNYTNPRIRAYLDARYD